MLLRLIRDIFSTYDLRVIILRELRVSQCWSRDLFRENFLLGLFHSKKDITIENLYLFFYLKYKYLMICFTVTGIRINAFCLLAMVVQNAESCAQLGDTLSSTICISPAD